MSLPEDPVVACLVAISRVGWLCALGLFVLQLSHAPTAQTVAYGKTTLLASNKSKGHSGKDGQGKDGQGKDGDDDDDEKMNPWRFLWELIWGLVWTALREPRALGAALTRKAIPAAWLWRAVYGWALLWTVAWATTTWLWVCGGAKKEGGEECVVRYSWVAVALFGVQQSRRLLECLWLHRFSRLRSRRMSVLQWLLAVGFYMCLALSLLFEPSSPLPLRSPHLLLSSLSPPLILFLLASILQNHSHRILAAFPSSSQANLVGGKYFIPQGGLFEYCSAPHYFAEVLVYAALLLLADAWALSVPLAFLFVLVTLASLAAKNHAWCLSVFGSAYPSSRSVIIPFIW